MSPRPVKCKCNTIRTKAFNIGRAVRTTKALIGRANYPSYISAGTPFVEKSMSLYRVLIAGGRSITDTELVYEQIDIFLKEIYGSHEHILLIVSNEKRGVNQIVIDYAKEHNIQLKKIRVEWEIWEKKARARNLRERLETAQFALIICDGSKNSKWVFNECIKKKKIKVKRVSLLEGCPRGLWCRS